MAVLVGHNQGSQKKKEMSPLYGGLGTNPVPLEHVGWAVYPAASLPAS